MDGTPNASPVTPTMTTKELSELQDLSRIQKEGQTLSGIGAEKYKGLLEKYHLAKSNEKPEDRVAEINKNLTEGAKNAPQLFNDRKTFENSYGYAQKPQNEKDALDAFWKTNQEQKKNALVDTLLNGGTVPDEMKKTVDYAMAQKSASILNQFKTANGTDIMDAIDS